MESGSFIRVTRNRPCPICGKPDWCVIIPKDSTNLIYCMRSHDRTNTIGADGNEYVFLKESSDGELFILRQDYKQPGFNKEKFAAKPKSYTAPATRKVDLIQPLSNEKLDLIYKDMLSMLVLDDRHRKYLKAQGWSDELIEKRMVKSYPESDDIYYTYHNRTKSLNMSRAELAKRLTKNHGSLVGVPGYYENGSTGTFYGPSGILFPMYDEKGYIKRLRIRMDFLDQKRPIIVRENDAIYRVGYKDFKITMKGVFEVKPDGSLEKLADNGYLRGKYRTLASFVEDPDSSVLRNKLKGGCKSSNEVSLYTLPGDDMSIFHIVEGEPKSIYSNYRLKSPVISVPGVNSYKILFSEGWIDKMKAMGMKLVVVAYDADKVTNKDVLFYESSLVNELINHGVAVAIADWDEADGKGLDDLLAGGHMPQYHVVSKTTG